MSRAVYYHGLRPGVDAAAPFRGPEVFLALDYDLADAYADESGVVLACEYLGRPPLVLDTAEAFLAAWQASGADEGDGPFHPYRTGRFAAWARAQGHDAVLVPPEALETEAGYEAIGGRLGDPQMIVLDPALVRVVGQA